LNENKLQLVVDDLTLREVRELRQLADGLPLEQIMSVDLELGLAALACVIKRRTEPGFTMDDAWDLRVSDLELVQPDPEASGDGNGATPQPSPVSGPSTPST
jgi:hypothetical protein